MTSQYLELFYIAKKKYDQQASRPGYPNGSLTWLRHLGGNKSAVDALEEALKNGESGVPVDYISPNIIETHFKLNPSFNHHSFNTYLLDELLRVFPSDDNWQKWNPTPLVFYRGTMFVISMVTPAEAFNHGLRVEKKSSSLEDYLNLKAGLVANKYLDVGAVQKTGQKAYTYAVTYRGCEAIDINGTWEKRGINTHSPEDAICVVSQIKPSDIHNVRYYLGNQCCEIQYNSGYQTKRSADDEPVSNMIVPYRDYPRTMLAQEFTKQEMAKTRPV